MDLKKDPELKRVISYFKKQRDESLEETTDLRKDPELKRLMRKYNSQRDESLEETTGALSPDVSLESGAKNNETAMTKNRFLDTDDSMEGEKAEGAENGEGAASTSCEPPPLRNEDEEMEAKNNDSVISELPSIEDEPMEVEEEETLKNPNEAEAAKVEDAEKPKEVVNGDKEETEGNKEQENDQGIEREENQKGTEAQENKDDTEKPKNPVENLEFPLLDLETADDAAFFSNLPTKELNWLKSHYKDADQMKDTTVHCTACFKQLNHHVKVRQKRFCF